MLLFPFIFVFLPGWKGGVWQGTKYIMFLTKYAASQQFNEIFFGISVFIRLILPVFETIGTTLLLVRFLQSKKQVNIALNQQGQQAKHMDQLTICLIGIAVCFLLFVFPYTVTAIFYYGNPTNCSFFKTSYTVFPLTLMNSSVNCGIYFWKLPPFKKAVKKLFQGNKVSDVSIVGSSFTAHTQ